MADTKAKTLRELFFGSLDTKYKAIKSQLQEPSDNQITSTLGGVLVLTGVVAPTTITPDYIGQIYVDTNADTMYVAYGLSEGNWSLIDGDQVLSSQVITVGDSAVPEAGDTPASVGDIWIGTGGKIFIATGTSAYTDYKELSRVAASPEISSGVIAPASTPGKVGDIYVDTSAKVLYIAVGTSASTDWKACSMDGHTHE